MMKYTSTYITSISMKEERNEIMMPGFLIWVLHPILHIRRIGWRNRIVNPTKSCIWKQWTKLVVGEVIICLIMANDDHHIKITDVYYVLGVAKHLLLVGQASYNGVTIKFIEDRAIIHPHKEKSLKQ